MRISLINISFLFFISIYSANGIGEEKYGYVDSPENNIMWLSKRSDCVISGFFSILPEKNINNNAPLKRHLVSAKFDVKNLHFGSFSDKSILVDVSSDIISYGNSNNNRGSVKKISYEKYMSLIRGRSSLEEKMKTDPSRKLEYSGKIDALEKDVRKINDKNFSFSGIEEARFSSSTVIKNGSECVIFLRAVGDQKKLELVDPVKGVLCGADAISVTKEFYEARRK